MTENNITELVYQFGRGLLLINEFGNGFVNLDRITIYIPKNKLSRAFHMETVDIKYSINVDGLYSGEVINYSLLNRLFVGLVHHIYQDNIYIYIPELKLANLVKIKLDSLPIHNGSNPYTNPYTYLDKKTWMRVKIIDETRELCGECDNILPNSINDILAAKYNLTQLENIPDTDPSPNSSPNTINQIDQIDQTYLETFTIDPPHSLDCDDAFSIELNIYTDTAKIYVHIANVAHYFNPSHPLWKTICERGTTFYGIDGKNWSMLPPNYANGKCSILPSKTTPVLTCEFLYSGGYDSNPRLEFIKWYPSIIISKAKFDYDTFDKLLLDNVNINPKYKILLDAARIIRAGYNDFIFGSETPAHWLVRYWMLHVNTIMCRNIYRYNAIPDSNKQKTLSRYINHKYASKYFPSRTDITDITDISGITRDELVKVCNENQADDPVLNYLGKVAMLKSRYTTDVELNYHYGIGKVGYTHWTSPIRRLPDLLNHCLLLGYVIPDEEMAEWIENSNLAELKQDQIEKFIITWKNAEKNKTGDILDGIIIGVMKTGIVVYIDSLGSKYTIHISKLSAARLEFNSERLFNHTANVNFTLFDGIRLRISKIFFDVMEFDLVI